MGKILLNGVTSIDIVNYVDEFPREDSDNRGVEQLLTLGGNATNSSTVLNQIDPDIGVLFVAVPTGNPLYDQLAAKNGLHLERCVRRPTDVAPLSTIVVNSEKGTRTILHSEGEVWAPNLEEFERTFADLGEFSWIHFEGRECAELCKKMDYIIDWKENQGVNSPTISVELEIDIPMDWAKKIALRSDVVFISKDFALMNGWEDMVAAVKSAQLKFDSNHKFTVICPWGEQGVAGNDCHNVIQIEAHNPKTVVDTLAAGDTFIATAIWSLNAGKTLRESLQAATWLAGEKCGRRSTLGLPIAKFRNIFGG